MLIKSNNEMIQNMQGFDQDVICDTISCKDEVNLVT